jgi:hypothetical protein
MIAQICCSIFAVRRDKLILTQNKARSAIFNFHQQETFALKIILLGGRYFKYFYFESSAKQIKNSL